MSAGAAATVNTGPLTRHHLDESLPYRPRLLSAGERTRRETLTFYSPRNNRIVTLTDAGPIALGLKLEFEPTLVAFVERPRRIAMSEKQHIDLTFWTRDCKGKEQFLLFIPSGGTIASTRGLAAVRDRETIDAAARKHGVEITYVAERDLLSASAERGAYWQLLPHVQHHRRLLVRSLVESSIEALLAVTPSLTLRGASKQLAERFTADQVAAVLAAMVHRGRLRIVAPVGFNEDSVLEVAHAA